MSEQVNHRRISLPLELHLEVVKILGSPPTDATYDIGSPARGGLHSLSLVHSAFRTATDEALFQRVIITPRNLEAFFYRVVTSKRAVPKVDYVAVLDFHDSDLNNQKWSKVIRILKKIPLDLRCLLLDLPLRFQYGNQRMKTLLQVLNKFPDVVEFISVQDEAYLSGWGIGPVLWPLWTNLKRLALYNIELEPNAVTSLRSALQMDVLCILNPRFQDPSVDENVNTLMDGTTGVCLFLDAENWGDEETDEDYIPFAKKEEPDPLNLHVVEASRKWLKRLSLVDVEAITETGFRREQSEHPTEWFRTIAVQGKIWDLGSYAVDAAKFPI